MLVILRKGSSDNDLRDVLACAELHAARAFEVPQDSGRRMVRLEGADGPRGPIEENLRRCVAVEEIVDRDLPFALVSRELHPESTRIKVGSAVFGGPRVVLIGGPCAVETREQLLATAVAAKEAGASILRGGAFKPRTSPYSFQGLGESGLALLRSVADECGLAVVTEVMSPEQVSVVSPYADMLQVGSRNIQNFALLDAVGHSSKPVLLKRGMMSEIDEFLASAEYIVSRGNRNVVLCERGIRTFERRTRNTLDIVAVPLLKSLSHLPVIVDPSHATGIASLVAPAARAAVAAGADGIMIEMHPEPHLAKCDGRQALLPSAFVALARELSKVARAVGREG